MDYLLLLCLLTMSTVVAILMRIQIDRRHRSMLVRCTPMTAIVSVLALMVVQKKLQGNEIT